MAKDEFRVEYTSVVGDLIAVQHEPVGLRAAATINGTAVDWSRWADGGDGSRQRGAGGREKMRSSGMDAVLE